MCNKLKHDHEEACDFIYDVVIRIRPDMKFTAPITQDMISSALERNLICIPNFHHHGGYCDHIALGDSQTMDTYCDLINSHIINQYMNPESNLKQWLIDQRIPIKEVGFIHYEIVRSEYDSVIIG
jgi:hypothetical protein